MSYENKGSKPGSFVDEEPPNNLERLQSIPPVEFTIPPNEPEKITSRCSAHQNLTAACQASARKDAPEHADPEKHVQCEQCNGNEEEPITYPEGGLQAWLVVLGSFMGTIVAFGMMNTVGIFHQYFHEHQLSNYDESTIGWIFGVYVFLAFFCGIQIGPYFDAHGPKLLMLAGSILMSASMLLLGLCTQFWHFVLVFGVLGGVGTSLIFTCAFAAIGHFFLVKRGNATGIAAAGGSLGGIIFPLMLQQLFPKLGFGWTTRIMGFIYIFCTGIAVLLVRSRLPAKPGQSVKPDLTIFKDKSYLLLTIGIYFMEWGLFVPITYITSFATSTGVMSPSFSYQLVAIFNAGSCLGRWAPGYVADKLGRFNSMIAALVLCVATSMTLWLPASLLVPLDGSPVSANNGTIIKALIITYSLIFGFSSGSNISLTPVAVGQLCETRNYGRYYATCYTIVSFGTLTGIPIAGSLIQAAGDNYWGVVVWTGLCYIVSLGCFIWSRGLKVGWKLGVKF